MAILIIGKNEKSKIERLKRKLELAEMENMALHKALLEAEWQVEVLKDLNERLENRLELQEKIMKAVGCL